MNDEEGEAVVHAPIETHYAGCRFRSRLEARWAVFFDHLNISWDYETQGYEVTRRLGLTGSNDDKFRYLPDFWLPKLEVFVEVKGSLTEPDYLRLLDAAGYLSSPVGGCNDGGGHDLVVLGPVSDPRSPRTPFRLHLHKGDLVMAPWTLTRTSCPAGALIADDSGWLRGDPEVVGRVLLKGDPHLLRDAKYCAALTAARSARFEHGERG